MTTGQFYTILVGVMLCAIITVWLDISRERRAFRLAVPAMTLLYFFYRLTTTPSNTLNSPAFSSSDSMLGLFLFVVLLLAFVVVLVNMVTSVWQIIRRHASRG